MNLALGFVFSFLIGSGASVALAAPNTNQVTTPETDQHPLSVEGQLSKYSLEPSHPVDLQLHLHLLPGYRAYADKLKVEILEPEGFHYQNMKIDPLQTFYDENSHHSKTGVIGAATLTMPIEAPLHLPDGDQHLHLQISYQACTAAYCLFPQKLEIEVPFHFQSVNPANSAGTNLTAAIPFPSNWQEAMGRSLAWAFLIAFIAGFLTSLTPCVFPLIPITIAVLGRNAHLHSHRKNILLSVLYVLGIALTYSSLGVMAAATGSMFGSFMNNPVILSVICVVFLTMAFSMFGAFELQAPLFIRQRLSGDLQLHGYSSAFIYGIIAGVVAGPCVGPVLVGILTYVAKTQNLWLGFWLLFVFALGMGQLFILLGYSSQLTKLLPKSGTWMESIKVFFGYLLIAAFLYYLQLLIPLRIWDGVTGLTLVALGSIFGAFKPLAHSGVATKLNKGLQQMLLFIGAAFVTIALFNLRPWLSQQNMAQGPVNSIEDLRWQPYTDAALSAAAKNHKPVLIDFWADWCTACKELESLTFPKPEFQKAAEGFVLLKFDATNDSELLTQLRSQYGLIGLPTLLLFDPQGHWRKDLTTTEVIEAPALALKMQQVTH